MRYKENVSKDICYNGGGSGVNNCREREKSNNSPLPTLALLNSLEPNLHSFQNIRKNNTHYISFFTSSKKY